MGLTKAIKRSFPRCGYDRCDFLEPMCSGVLSAAAPPGFYSSAMYLKRTFSARSFSHCILSRGQFVKFVSLLAFYIRGQWLSSVPWCSGKRLHTFTIEPRRVYCLWLSFLGSLTVGDSHQWWSGVGRRDLCEAHNSWCLFSWVMLMRCLAFQIYSLAHYIGRKHTLTHL